MDNFGSRLYCTCVYVHMYRIMQFSVIAMQVYSVMITPSKLILAGLCSARNNSLQPMHCVVAMLSVHLSI